MDITPLIAPGRQVIQSYGAGRFKISGAVYDGPVIVFPDRTEIWSDREDFSILAAAALDLVLYGSGAVMPPDMMALRVTLKNSGLNAEIMTTGAACRTYNVLMAEGRRVAAALIPV